MNVANKDDLSTLKKSTRPDKKYMIRYKGKTIHFGGDPRKYQHFRDSTPLKLYSHLDHNDLSRLEKYYKRHGKTNDKSSAKYWSNKYLWT